MRRLLHQLDRAGGFAGFLLGSSGMLACMYSTQAILPQLAREFRVTPSEAGLSISVVVAAVAVGAWVWGPISDRYGRRATLLAASLLLAVPTVLAGAAPTFETFLACRALQGACMPGLLTVGPLYVAEAYTPRLGSRAIGYYIASLVAGGLVGRVGVALVSSGIGWRYGIGGLAVLPLVGFAIMRRSLVEPPPPERTPGRRRRVAAQLRNARLLRATAAGCALTFMFVGTFSYVTFRLEEPPFSLDATIGSLIFLLWIFGAVGPLVGRAAGRFGWERVTIAMLAATAAGIALTVPDSLPPVALGLALTAVANFAGVVTAQLGITESTTVDRGVASAVYFSVYYTANAIGGYVPGLAWQAYGWNGVAVMSLGAVGAAIVLLAAADPGLRRRLGREPAAQPRG